MHRSMRRRLKDHQAEARWARGTMPLPNYEGEREHCQGWASLAMMAVSAITSASAASQKADAEQSAAQYQAAVARNNEIVAKQNATYALQKGEASEAAKRQQTAQMIGSQRAKIGASGLTLDAGSPLRLQSDIAQLGEVDALTIRNNAAREAYGWESQGVNYEAEARLDEMRGRDAERAGQLGMFSSIIGGASSISNKWSSMQQSGLLDSFAT